MISSQFPDFRPHPLVRGGDLQTIAGVYLPGPRLTYRARRHLVTLADGDRIVLHDDCPLGWQAGDRAALLIHGLSGCHSSHYMTRIAAELEQSGVRAFRMDLRGCGAGAGLARLPYHSGRSEDAAAAITAMTELCPGSPLAIVGFSMGGNIALKLLGEIGNRPCGNLDRIVAICPPIDLAMAVERIHRRRTRIYERHFLRRLLRQVKVREQTMPDAPSVKFRRLPQSIWEFDDQFTAPVCGFGDAPTYYRLCGAIRVAEGIRLPALVIAAHDDPLVPTTPLEALRDCPSVRLQITRHGGHLGFVGRREGERRWLDSRIVEWITASDWRPKAPR